MSHVIYIVAVLLMVGGMLLSTFAAEPLLSGAVHGIAVAIAYFAGRLAAEEG